MASLTLTVGTLNTSRFSSNEKANTILNRYADAIGASGTLQERADAVLASLIDHMLEEGKRHRRRQEVEAALATLLPELDATSWT